MTLSVCPGHQIPKSEWRARVLGWTWSEPHHCWIRVTAVSYDVWMIEAAPYDGPLMGATDFLFPWEWPQIIWYCPPLVYLSEGHELDQQETWYCDDLGNRIPFRRWRAAHAAEEDAV